LFKISLTDICDNDELINSKFSEICLLSRKWQLGQKNVGIYYHFLGHLHTPHSNTDNIFGNYERIFLRNFSNSSTSWVDEYQVKKCGNILPPLGATPRPKRVVKLKIVKNNFEPKKQSWKWERIKQQQQIFCKAILPVLTASL